MLEEDVSTTTFGDEFVPNIESTAYHPKWVRQSPGEAAKWAAFRDKALAYKKGDALVPPDMASHYGKALVAAGKIHMSVIDLGAVWEPPPPPPPTGGLTMFFPAGFHIWGGQSEITACSSFDFVSGHVEVLGNAAAVAKAGGNPRLICVALSDPSGTGVYAHHFTYGGNIYSWPGVNDTLQPNPQGSIPGWTGTSNPEPNEGTGDFGIWQQDHLQGYAVYRTATADKLKKMAYYSYKVGNFAAKGIDGIWSDNLFTGAIVDAGWAYGGNWAASGETKAAWDAGVISILSWSRGFGVPLIGGNTLVRTDNGTIRQHGNVAQMEDWNYVLGRGRTGQNTVDIATFNGATNFANRMVEVDAFMAAGGDRFLGCMHNISPADTVGRNFGQAAACIAGSAYMVYSVEEGWHSSLTKVTELQNNRGRLGAPTASAIRSGNSWSRAFQHGSVSINFDNWSFSYTYT